MNRRVWWKQAVCIALAVLLLLIFCWVGHSCDHSHCPVCLLTATFRLSMSLTALWLGLIFLPKLMRRLGISHSQTEGREETLVAWKVKLSD